MRGMFNKLKYPEQGFFFFFKRKLVLIFNDLTRTIEAYKVFDIVKYRETLYLSNHETNVSYVCVTEFSRS